MPAGTGKENDTAAATALTLDIGRVVARSAVSNGDFEALTQPLLEALAKLADLESTYLTVFDWQAREQEVRFVYNAAKIEVEKGTRIEIPVELSPESLPGVTRSPADLGKAHPDSRIARRLGLKRYVSVPVTVSKHQLYGMLCGASRKVGEVSEPIVSVMEFFAQIIADHVTRSTMAATEHRASVAEERLRARARFLATAEHQLKTPLTSIVGMSHALLHRWEAVPAEQRNRMLTAIFSEGQALQVQIDELLLEARSDVQARELMPIRVELGPIIERVATAFDIVSSPHQVVAEVDPAIVADVDPAALYQVLGLLLDNAIKYSDGGVIRLKAKKDAHDIQIDVVDEGMGIPDDIDIFEAFVRGRSNEMQGKSGIGLGLHIVRNLVEAMGGSVTAMRHAEGGSTLSVRIPAPGQQ